MSEKMIVACPECGTRFIAPLEKFLPEGRKVRCAKCGHSWFQRVESSETVDAQSIDTPVKTPTPTPTPVETEIPVSAPTESIIDRAARAKETQSSSDMATKSPEQDTERGLSPSDAPSGIFASSMATAGTNPTAKVSAAEFDREGDLSSDDNTSPYIDEPQGGRARKRSFWPRAILYTIAAAIIAGALGYFFKDKISSAIPALDPPLTSWKSTIDGVVSTAVPPNRALKIENVQYDLSNSDDEPLMLLTAEVVNESGSAQKAPKLTATIYDENSAVLKTVTVSPEDPVSEIAAQTRLDYFLRLPFPPEKLERVEVDFAK